jgi:hypothetical protein
MLHSKYGEVIEGKTRNITENKGMKNDNHKNSDDLRSKSERAQIQSGETYFKAMRKFLQEAQEEESRLAMKYSREDFRCFDKIRGFLGQG